MTPEMRTDPQGRRYLSLGGSLCQSIVGEMMPYQTVMLGIGLASEPERVLLMGLGGGVMAAQMVGIVDHIQAVERSEEVVTLARRVFGLPEEVRVEVQEAYGWLQMHRDEYDVVFVDLFDGQGMSSLCDTQYFWADLRGRMVVANLMGDIPRALKAMCLGLRCDVVCTQSPDGNTIATAMPGMDMDEKIRFLGVLNAMMKEIK